MALPEYKKADLTFSALSDLHMTHRGEGLQKLNQYFSLCSRMTPKLDAIVLAGDIIYQKDISGGGKCEVAYSDPYVYLAMARKKYVEDIPMIYSMGNHEYPQGHCEPEYSAMGLKAFTDAGHKTKSHEVINGYHFIKVSINNYGCTFSDEDAHWAVEETKKALKESGNKPVFVVYHPPIPGTVSRSVPDYKFQDEFSTFMLSDKRIINVVGHLHTPQEDPGTIYQKENGATVIHCPDSAVGHVDVRDFSDIGHEFGLTYSRSLYFEVNGTEVKIHKINNLYETEVGEPWVVDVKPEAPQYYTNDRYEKGHAPKFEKDTKVEADFFRGCIHFRFKKATCEPLPFNDDSEVPTYKFRFYKAGTRELVASKKWHSDFAENNHFDVFRAPVNVTLPSGDYDVEIIPSSYFHKDGEPIFGKLHIPENAEAPKNYLLPTDVYGMI